MTREEFHALLTRLQVLDNRQVDRVTADAWWPIIGHLRYDDALEALNNHFRDNPDTYLRPGHIAQGARRIREARSPHHDHSLDDRGDAPRPANFEALSAAWDDADAWEEQVSAYNAQLRHAGKAHYALDAGLTVQRDATAQTDRPALPAPSRIGHHRATPALDVPDITEPRRSTR